MAQAYPSLNGFAPSWADIQVTFTADGGALLDMSDIAGIKWSRKVDIGVQQATGGRPVARTTGSSSCEASMTLYKSGYRQLMRSLAENAPERGGQVLIGLVAFDILIQHTPPNETDIYTLKIKGCRLMNDSEDMKEGTDPDKVEVSLHTLEIVHIDSDGTEINLV